MCSGMATGVPGQVNLDIERLLSPRRWTTSVQLSDLHHHL